MKDTGNHAVVTELAIHFLDHGPDQLFQEMARVKRKYLSADDIPDLLTMLHLEPRAPASFDSAKHGLGGWLNACQFSIFEILFNFGEVVLPDIRKIAWGEYDWIQGNAIELLIRFAAEGIQTERILAEINSRFPDIQYEARLYALESLVVQLRYSKKTAPVIDKLMQIEDFRNAFEELTQDR